jgi:hypothetical protein
MTKALPYTEASIARLIRGIEKAGKFAIGAKPDGTVIISDKPFNSASLIPAELQPSPEPTRRMGEYFNGGQGEAQGS